MIKVSKADTFIKILKKTPLITPVIDRFHLQKLD